jgi:hypothetical protein
MYIASSTGRARSSDTNSARLARRANSTAASELLARATTIDFAGDARHLRSGLLLTKHLGIATTGIGALLLFEVFFGVFPGHDGSFYAAGCDIDCFDLSERCPALRRACTHASKSSGS